MLVNITVWDTPNGVRIAANGDDPKLLSTPPEARSPSQKLALALLDIVVKVANDNDIHRVVKDLAGFGEGG